MNGRYKITGSWGILAVTKLKASNPTSVVMLSNVTEKDIAMALISMGIAEEEETPEEAKDVTEVFSDVHTDWYTDYVQYVYDNGLMTGIKGTDRFEPNADVTREQLALMM